jgi:FkbM family methyltransferase
LGVINKRKHVLIRKYEKLIVNLKVLLNKLNIHPVLMDIGCSGDRFKLWDDIASESTLIALDPDKREINSQIRKRYKNTINIDKVVCVDDELDEVEFIFTKYPFCSSLLHPDMEELDNYIFHDYFTPLSIEMVQATSLNRIIREHGLTSIDWIKIDAQGMDLAIIKSLDDRFLDKVTVIDVEPGLMSAYKGEDHFPKVHEYMVNNGFWLADLHCQKFTRMNSKSLGRIAELLDIPDANGIKPFLKTSPTAAEARYFRTISSAAEAGEKELLLLYICSVLCGYMAFAFDVYSEYEKIYGKNTNSKYLKDYLSIELKSITYMPLWKHMLAKNIFKYFPNVIQCIRSITNR